MPNFPLNSVEFFFYNWETSSEQDYFNSVRSKQEIFQIRRKIVRIIECLSNESVSAEKLVEFCKNLSKNDYADAIEERTAYELCGYPLCSNHVKPTSQKYHIAYKVNRVYDITDRKGFCSNECYNASCYLKDQLSDIPVWYQDDPIIVKLLSKKENKGSAGSYIEMSVANNTEVIDEKQDWFTEKDKSIITDELSSCAERFADLKIKEKNYKICSPKMNQFPAEIGDEVDNSIDELNDNMSYCDDFLLNEEKNLDETFMPIPKGKKTSSKKKTPILIDPTTKAVIEPVATNCVESRLICNILKEWITQSTLDLLSDEEISKVPIIQNMNHNKDEINQTDDDKISQTVYNTVKSTENNEMELYLEKVKCFFQGEDLIKDKQTKAVKFKTGKKGKVKIVNNKSSASSTQNTLPIINNESVPDPIPVEKLILPKVHTYSQNALRQQVVCDQLKKSFSSVLSLVGIHYRVVSEIILQLVSTFRLTATNVVHKPLEWKLISLFLFRMITQGAASKKMLPNEFISDEIFSSLLNKTGLRNTFSIKEIDLILQDIL